MPAPSLPAGEADDGRRDGFLHRCFAALLPVAPPVQVLAGGVQAHLDSQAPDPHLEPLDRPVTGTRGFTSVLANGGGIENNATGYGATIAGGQTSSATGNASTIGNATRGDHRNAYRVDNGRVTGPGGSFPSPASDWAVTAHWAAERMHAFWAAAYGRDGIDGGVQQREVGALGGVDVDGDDEDDDAVADRPDDRVVRDREPVCELVRAVERLSSVCQPGDLRLGGGEAPRQGGGVSRLALICSISAVVSAAEFTAMQASLEDVHIEPELHRYAVQVVGATRRSTDLEVGASPRGSLALLKVARARAVIHGRDFVTPDDVRAIAVPVLAHRVVLRPEVWARHASPEEVVAVKGLGRHPVPRVFRTEVDPALPVDRSSSDWGVPKGGRSPSPLC